MVNKQLPEWFDLPEPVREALTMYDRNYYEGGALAHETSLRIAYDSYPHLRRQFLLEAAAFLESVTKQLTDLT